jgi:hypothetical protein
LIISAVDFATWMIVSWARSNASSTVPAAFAAFVDVGWVPATTTASTWISVSPTRTWIN